jgi:hypothetical protein
VTETTSSRRRSRLIRIGSTVAVVVAAGLAVWGFSRSNDDRPNDTTPGIGVINAPAEVNSTRPDIVGTAPATNDVPTIPTGTADVALPPASTDIVTP